MAALQTTGATLRETVGACELWVQATVSYLLAQGRYQMF